MISKYILNAKEIEFDAVAQEGVILNYAISEHVENAGVHSGDATLVLPAQKLYVQVSRRNIFFYFLFLHFLGSFIFRCTLNKSEQHNQQKHVFLIGNIFNVSKSVLIYLLPLCLLNTQTVRTVKQIASEISRALNISGPFNIQLLAKDNAVRVIECNLRASRTFPFISKTFDVNFITLATKVRCVNFCYSSAHTYTHSDSHALS